MEGTSLVIRFVSFLLRTSIRPQVCAVLALPLVFFIFFHWVFNPYIATLFLLLSCFLALLSLSLLFTPIGTHAPSSHSSNGPSSEDGLPKIPKTAAQVKASMDETEFEKFSAALIIAVGEGHRFHMHSGKSGDEGVDALLLNLYSNRVVIQSKHFAPDVHVGQPDIRDFFGSIAYHNAVYGFFVTTSTFTDPALHFIRGTRGRIRIIDAWRMDALLKYRYREVALAYRDVLEALGEEVKTA